MKLRNPGDILNPRVAEVFVMNRLITKVVDGFSSLRSSILVCLTLMTTGASSLIDTRNSSCYSSSSPLKLVNIEEAKDNLPVGAHLITSRKFYMHHGIHLGGGKVAHYSGFSSSFKPGPIEVTDLERFANGKPVWSYEERCEYSNHEIANRARSRIGENQYRILSNNCEHYCSWCVSGKSYSAQVRAYFHCPLNLFSFISGLEPNLIA
jgi:hypothetical protein